MADPITTGLAIGAGNALLSKISSTITQGMNRADLDYAQSRYLSPQAQVRNLVAAGLNPAVAMGNQSPVFTSAGQLGNNYPALGTTSLSDMANAVAAVAAAKKSGAEEVGQELQNQIIKQTFDKQIEKIGLDNQWSKENIAKIQQEVGLMSGQFNLIQSQIDKLNSEKKLTDKEVDWFDRHMSAEIAYIKSSKDYQEAMAGLTDSQKELLDSTMEDLKSITSLNRQQMETIVGLLGKYGDAQAIVGLLTQVVGSASDLIGSIASFKNVGKVVETITGSTTQKSDGSWTTTNTKTTKR